MLNLFQDQFKAVTVNTNSQLLWLSAYIHLNPLVAEITDNLTNYHWSSYLEYSENSHGICQKDLILGQFESTEEFLEYTQIFVLIKDMSKIPFDTILGYEPAN